MCQHIIYNFINTILIIYIFKFFKLCKGNYTSMRYFYKNSVSHILIILKSIIIWLRSHNKSNLFWKYPKNIKNKLRKPKC